MASAYVEGVLTGRWGPDQQTLTEWGRLGYDVRKVMQVRKLTDQAFSQTRERRKRGLSSPAGKGEERPRSRWPELCS